MSISCWEQGDFDISTDPERLEKDRILANLRATYWAAKSSPENLWLSICNSRTYGVYHKSRGQVGFGRAVTDYARFAWVSDIYIEDAHKGQGLGKWLMACILADPQLATVNRWMLATDDAHGLYRQHGFETLEPAEAAKVMQRRQPLV